MNCYVKILITLTLFLSASLLAHHTRWSSQDDCLAAPAKCIDGLDKELENTEKFTHHWYGMKNNLLLAIWEAGREERLVAELADIDHTHGPPVFRTTVLTLKAKFAVLDKEMELAKALTEQAVTLIKAVNEVSVNMTRYAEVVVLYNSYLGDTKQALEFVNWVEDSNVGNTNAVRLSPYHTAVGHLYNNLKDYEKARQFYLRAADGNLRSKKYLRVASSFHNVARTYQSEKNYEAAIEYFTQAMTYFQQLGDEYFGVSDYSRIRFAETLYLAGKKTQAKYVFAQIQRDKLGRYFVDAYNEVAHLLAQEPG